MSKTKLILFVLLILQSAFSHADNFRKQDLIIPLIKERTALVVGIDQELSNENLELIADAYGLALPSEINSAFQLIDNLNFSCFLVNELIGSSPIVANSKIIVGIGSPTTIRSALATLEKGQLSNDLIVGKPSFSNENAKYLLALSDLNYPTKFKSFANKRLTSAHLGGVDIFGIKNSNLAFKIVESRSTEELGQSNLLSSELEDIKLLYAAYPTQDPTIVLNLMTDLGKSIFEKLFLTPVD